MHPVRRNNLIVEIENRLFVDTSQCYYQFSVPISDLNTDNNRYYFDITFERMQNVIIYLNNGTRSEQADDPISVSFFTGYRF